MSLTLSIIALVVSVISLALAMWQFVPLIKRYMLRRKIMRLKKSIYGTHSNFLVMDEFLTADGEKEKKDD